MKFLGQVEGLLERLFIRLAGTSRQHRVQPQEIAKALDKAMLSNRRVSIGCVYVPNRFSVYLSKQDWQNLEPLHMTVVQDIREYLVDRTRQRQLTVPAPIHIEFLVESGIKLGTFRHEAVFDESRANECSPDAKSGGISLSSGNAHTQVYKLSPENSLRVQSVGKRNAQAGLVVLEGPDQGRQWALDLKPTGVGRGKNQYIQLKDPGVSRQHAVIRWTRGRYWIEDNNSKNGLSINGHKVTKAILTDGDIVQLGGCKLGFHMVNDVE
ncbi:MAG: DUF3662 and FHA domain-containing protein [Firmicutes bacterium]|nr:DUF3662 and FHA domain-containing protein [Bacillota bacterium]